MTATETADLIIRNADVRTMDPARPRVRALAVKANRILALGDNTEVMALEGPATRVIDADGGTLMPGFYESHVHIFPGGVALQRLNVSKIFGLEALRAAVAGFAAANPDDDLLVAYGANYSMFGDDVRISRHLLDEVIADRPFYMIATDFHTGFANTLAIEKAGLMAGKNVGSNGEVVLGDDGTATGELREGGAMAALLAIRSKGGREECGMVGINPQGVGEDEREADIATLLAAMEYCARHGITKLVNMDGNRYQLELVAEMERRGTLPCRIEVPYRIPVEPVDDPIATAVAMTRDFATNKVSCGRVKMFMDGVFDNWTALKLEDYPDRPGYRGAPLVPPERFNTLCVEADAAGLQIAVHAVGNGAVRAVLNGYEEAVGVNGRRDSRHRVEHIDNIHPDDIDRLSRLGAVASMQPVHPPGSAGLPLEPTVTLMGRENWAHAFNWRAIKDAGAPVCLATDWPISPLDPLYAIQCALTRKPWAEGLPDPRLTLDECLEAYTATGAFAAFDEDRLGQLAPGMLADLVLIEGDLASLHDEGDLKVRAVLTVCDGSITHETLE